MKRKLMALILTVVLLSSLMASIPTTVSATAIPDNANISRLAAAEGIVLLENNGVLPFLPTANVAVFGQSRHMNGTSYPTDGFGKDGWISYGGGSGEVTAPYVVDLLTGLTNRKNEGKLASITNGGNNPTADTVNAAALTNDVAIVVIRRWTAEASDLSAGAGGYLLSAAETTMVQRVTAAFSNVVVVMNAANAIDMTWVETYSNIKAVVFSWYPGMEGGNALADVLCGVVNPSGKLVDTFARNINDYPSTATFAQTNPQYTEDIYVGYRYFATVDPNYQKVKYEFGYGLSYSNFDITDKAIRVDGDELVATAKVTNNGPMPGKEVLQVYYSPPTGELNKPAFELSAFAKTSLLGVGSSETVEMRFPISSMASYDDVGKTGKISAYVMEAGDYNVYIGNSIKNATKSTAAGKYTQADLRVTEQLSKQLTPPTAFNRLIDPVNGTTQSTNWTPAGGAPTPGTPNPNPGPMVPATRVPWTSGGTIMLEDVYKEPGYMYDFVAQMTDAELRTMSRHQTSSILANGTGAIGKLAKYGIPEVNTADGPAGLRIGTIGARTVIATCFPIGTLLACTWNEKLCEDVGAAVGAEMELNKVDIWLAPGLNIHRHPRNGRNFEYYSEDPLVSGKATAAVTKGVQRRGGLVTIKHFAANNQETNRYTTNSQVSERALREVYLKGFEIAVKEANPGCVMTSYNRINGSYTEGSAALLTNVLRNEWGFKGLVMTDWWNGRASSAVQIAAGCNVKMDDADSSLNTVSRTALEANIRAIMGPIMRSFAFAQEISTEPMLKAIEVSPMQIVVGKAANVKVTVTGKNLEGMDVKAGIKGYPGTFVSIPGNTGATVDLNVTKDLLPIGTYDVVMTLNGVESNTKASLNVGLDKAYYYLVANNGKIVGANAATFNNTGSMTTMVANLDELNDYAKFEILNLVQDRVHLLMMNGYLITMEGSSYGNNMVRPRSAVPGSPTATGWEALIFENQDDGTVKIKRIGTDGTWYVNVAANGNLSTVANTVGNTGKFTLVPIGSPVPTITSVIVSPTQINEGVAAVLNVTVAGSTLADSEVKVGIKGFAGSFVSVPGDTGATVTISIPADMLESGTYDVVAMVDDVEANLKGSLMVVGDPRVSFNYNYLDAPENPPVRKVAYGTAIGELPVPPIRPGFVFNGWIMYDGKTTVAANNACLMPTYYNASTIVTADTLLVANWSHVLRVEQDNALGTVTATAYLSDQTIKSSSVRVIIAAYDDVGRLLKVFSDAYAVPAKKALRLTQQSPADVFGLDSATFDSKTLVANIPAETALVKAYMWDADTLMPVCGAVEPVDLNLIWSDEFDGDTVDSSKWYIPPDNNGGGNNEIQYYRPQNAEINKTDAALDGSTGNTALRIQATRTSGLPRGSWASSKLTTEGKFSVKYGRIEARIKNPVNDQGFWPAFWMMPSDNAYGGWASSGEIDIMENKSRQSGTISSALHYGGAWAASNVMNATRNRYATLRAGAAPTQDGSPVDTILPGFSVGEWHTYAVEWYPDRFEWFVDGVRYHELNTWYTTTSNGVRLQQTAPFDQTFYIIFNLAVGGNFDGGRAPQTGTNTGNMYIDYVRVYQ